MFGSGHGSCTVGVEDGVVRAGDFAALTDLLDAAKSLQTERERLLAGVEEEIDAMRTEARQQVEADTVAARTAREEGWAAGHAEGQAAAAQWTEQALREAASAQRSLIRQTQRLSQIVSLALERIIEHEDRVTLFNRSLAAITKLVRDVPMATLRVSPAELESALTAVTAFAPCAAGRLQIEVKADSRRRRPAARLFESDEGLIDAGLKTQLAAIRRAMERAAAHLLLDDTEPAAAVVGLETSTAGAPRRTTSRCARGRARGRLSCSADRPRLRCRGRSLAGRDDTVNAASTPASRP